MSRLVTIVVLGVLLGLGEAAMHGQVLAPGRDFSLPRAEVSLTYSPTRNNSGPGQCGCFFMNGATIEGNFRTYRGFTTVVDLTAEHTAQIHNTGQPFSMAMLTAGTRLNYRLGGDRFYRYKPFIQGLVGAARGFNSAFPDKAGFIHPTANSVALLIGVGFDVKYRRLLSFRAFQFDYGYTRLPNGSSNDQNLFRISSGVTVHLF